MTDPTQIQGEPAATEPGTTPAPSSTTTPPPSGTSDAPQFEAPFNINDVPAEYREHVERYTKQVHGAFTRKTMELAQQRQAAEQAVAFYDRFHADDEAARDAAVTEYLKANGWDLGEEEETSPAETTDAPPAHDPELLARIERAEQQLQARDEADQRAAHEAYLEDFQGRYESGVDQWAKANGYESGDKLPDYLKTQIAGYVRGVPAVNAQGQPVTGEFEARYPNMDAALALLDADRAAYLASKDVPTPNTKAVTATQHRPAPTTDQERRARALEVAGRHL
jgi:hypothetical protein